MKGDQGDYEAKLDWLVPSFGVPGDLHGNEMSV